jgi:hypothetical protein
MRAFFLKFSPSRTILSLLPYRQETCLTRDAQEVGKWQGDGAVAAH